MTDLFNLFRELDDNTMKQVRREEVIRAPFSWPGGKSKSIREILPHLPYRNSYIEPFGGSGAILLARQPSNLEVFNDRHSGVVALYRCIRDEDKLQKLVKRLELIIHSREEFRWCKNTWESYEDDIERAARWYYMLMFSFSSLGRNFGRATKGKAQLAKAVANHLKDFDRLHCRVKNVIFENQDYRSMLLDFDNPDAVFYLDPPYYQVHSGTYKYEMTSDEHRDLLNQVMRMEGYVAVSAYSNELYNSYDWDKKLNWETPVSIRGMAFHEENHKTKWENSQRENASETLYIKE